MTKAEHLDDLVAGPFREAAIVRSQGWLERQRTGAGPFHRPTDPETSSLGSVERVGAEPAVTEDAVTTPISLHLERRLEAEALEGADPLGRRAGQLLELRAVVEGEDSHFGPVPVPVGGPVDLFELGIVAQVLADDPSLEEELQLLPARVGGRAAVTGHGEGAAGVGVFQRGRPVLAVEPALQQARHEAVTGAEDVEDLDREAGTGLAGIEAFRHVAREGDRPERPALADERRLRDRPHRS